MNKYDVQDMAKGYSKSHRRQKRWHNIVTVLACIVVFITTYALIMPAITEEVINLKDYVEEHNGSISITLFDSSGQPVTDEVIEGDKYKLTFGMYIPDGGFSPGTYIYKLPDGLLVNPQPGKEMVLADGTVIAIWSLSEDGSLKFEFNENANGYQNIEASLDIIVEFELIDGSIDFDGDVNVTIKPAPETGPITPEVEKYGEIATAKDGTPIIEWSVSVQGGEGFPLTGQTVTDTIVGDGHTFDGADKDIWVNVWTTEGYYYSWEIDESETIWTGTTWEYTIPDTIICIECNDPAHYANGSQHEWGNGENHEVILEDDWRCSFYLESVITDEDAIVYQNDVNVGTLSDTAKILTGTGVGIVKTGELVDGVFNWHMDISIPASDNLHSFHIWDSMRIKIDGQSTKFAVDFENAVLKYKVGDEWYIMPDLDGLYADKPNGTQLFAYTVWFDEDETDRKSGSEINFYNLCTCTSDHCSNWNTEKDRCGTSAWQNRSYCKCWHQDEITEITIDYYTVASADIIAEYGGMGYPLTNTADLGYTEVVDGESYSKSVSSDDAVHIPGVFNKEIVDRPGAANQYTAIFNITVNEEMQDLSSMAETGGITIVDKMSETLFYESGSMVVRQTDMAGNVVTLQEGVDYIITLRDIHGMEISIPNPGPYMYTLDYSCVLDLSGYNGSPIPYNNSAEITLFGKTYTVGGDEQFLTSYTTSAENFNVTVYKEDSIDGDRLKGAVFGLYNELGNLIATMETDENGVLMFETDMSSGVIFKKNTPYYILEQEAPPGYLLDPTQHWFYFSEDADADIEAAYPGIHHYGKVANEYFGDMTLVNQHCMFELPSTGGGGEMLCYLISAISAVAGLAVFAFSIFSKMRKHRLRC